MSSLHTICTATCARQIQSGRCFREFAHITHIFLRYFYRELNSIYMQPRFTQSLRLNESYKNTVQCVQTLKSIACIRCYAHSYICALVSLLCRARGMQLIKKGKQICL